jgi:hydroxymethylbilane synthase
MAQTEEVLSRLRTEFPETRFDLVGISTRGDRRKDSPLLSLGRGAFSKDMERALLEGEIDLAVHSAKDLTATLPDGLVLGGIVPRGDPRDVQVNRWGVGLSELPENARIGTSSPRRAALLAELRSDLVIAPIRGNVGTRLDKVGRGEYDGVVLAAAGIARIGRRAEITEYFSTESFTPDVGQGTLAVELRATDASLVKMLKRIDHAPTSAALEAERAFLRRLGGGCKVPVACYARLNGQELRVLAMAAVPDGSRILRAETFGDVGVPASAGVRAAEALLRQGAGEFLQPE